MSEEIMADIQRSLGRIEQKVDSALSWQQTHVSEDRVQFSIVREDIQSLKLTRAAQSGKSTVINYLVSAVVSAATSLAGFFLQRHSH